tara:strand:- start:270 stop:488 length:219 start_codon:yes stop_codon:yes gene_type:complete
VATMITIRCKSWPTNNDETGMFAWRLAARQLLFIPGGQATFNIREKIFFYLGRRPHKHSIKTYFVFVPSKKV